MAHFFTLVALILFLVLMIRTFEYLRDRSARRNALRGTGPDTDGPRTSARTQHGTDPHSPNRS